MARRLATHQEHALWHETYMATYLQQQRDSDSSRRQAHDVAVESADRAALALSERIGLKDDGERVGPRR